jgi:GTP-dependent phosphoenolpyruvate carboxykinase
LTLAELPRRTADLAGVLRGRTMYVIPYADVGPSAGRKAGLAVTDSPHIVDGLRRRIVTGQDALDALQSSHEMVAELHLAFPPRHIAVGISHDAPEIQEPFGPCEKGQERRRSLLREDMSSAKIVPCTVCGRICPNREAARYESVADG